MVTNKITARHRRIDLNQLIWYQQAPGTARDLRKRGQPLVTAPGLVATWRAFRRRCDTLAKRLRRRWQVQRWTTRSYYIMVGQPPKPTYPRTVVKAAVCPDCRATLYYQRPGSECLHCAGMRAWRQHWHEQP